MKGILSGFVALVAAFAIGAEASRPVRRKGMPSPEERARIYRRHQERKLAKEGGVVERADAANRHVVLANAQSLVPAAEIEALAAALVNRYAVGVEVLGHAAEITAEGVADVLKDRKAGLAVVFVDMPSWPMLLVAPEARWAALNVRALAPDGQGDRLRERFQREAWRAFGFVGGAANTLRGECVMRPVETVADLDHLKAMALSPEPEMRIKEHLAALGIRPHVRASYREACREGWAPAPTNDIQRAIFEQVKADKERGPANPIVIPPPSQKK